MGDPEETTESDEFYGFVLEDPSGGPATIVEIEYESPPDGDGN